MKTLAGVHPSLLVFFKDIVHILLSQIRMPRRVFGFRCCACYDVIISDFDDEEEQI